MWWQPSLKNILAALLLLGSLAACGFEPIYGARNGSGEVIPYTIHVDEIAGGRPAQELRVQLENLLDPLSAKQPDEYRLSVSLKEELSPLVIERDRRISRYNLSYTAQFTLTDLKTNQVIYQGSSKLTGSYDRVQSDYATHAAQNDTAIRVMREMAKDIKVRLMAVLARETGKAPPLKTRIEAPRPSAPPVMQTLPTERQPTGTSPNNENSGL